MRLGLIPTTAGKSVRGGPIAIATLLALLSACSHKDAVELAPLPEPPPLATAPNPAAPQTAPNLNARQRTALIYDLMNRGEADQARAEARRLQSDYPTNRAAADLLEQIDGDPKALFGTDSFAYVVRPGDTFPTLAARFLGAGSKFYALARYNGIAVPSTLQPGQTIMIPGRQRDPAPLRERRAPRPPRRAGVTSGAAQGAPAAVAIPVPRGPRADPGRAARLRRAGLEQMNAGSIGRAVQLLQRATTLDPANAAIAADLDRARRIQSTVQGRR
ncbi:LysM peptidoglycan-binding domain-containing protein [Sphingomonas montana]|uniref:LysM peptidoglycan-binding domain-containing protein n=1 Tax=Sphingomonas montana TaxID=1843236 RepID=UPI0013EBA0FB|nr:LysM peptidoglycan-binding domain-containing protein [Sphingomonas montana]